MFVTCYYMILRKAFLAFAEPRPPLPPGRQAPRVPQAAGSAFHDHLYVGSL